ncbi:MAG TPA: peptidase inhibitor family I36 protein [Solirubrobacterales bacterium]|nr:peptidase inhibitor family I36 protein [Solirubrobacterales bacterium]
MRFLRCLLAVGCALAIFASVALAEEEPIASSSPHIVSSSGGVTTYSDGAKVVEPASFNDCPDGWVCLWENKEYSGRMLEFQDRGFWQNLTDYGFNDQTTAWRNRTNDDARLAEDINGGGERICLQPNSSNSQLSGFNDKASSIIIYKTATVC